MRNCLNKTAWILLLFAWLFAGEAASQHHLGVRAGYGGGQGRFQPKREMRFLMGYPSAGISWKYYGAQPIVGGVQADLQYVKKGFKQVRLRIDGETGNEYIDSTYIRTVSSIELPFFWQIHFYMFNRNARLYANIGAYAAYHFDSYEYEEGGALGEGVKVGRPYEMNSVRDNQFEYGLAGGFGLSVLFNRFEAFVEARYNYGFSDLYKASGKNPGTNLLRSPIDMLNVSAGFYYRLGKGGILAPPAGSNRPKESWDSIPTGPRQVPSGSSSGSGGGGERPATPNTNRTP